MSEYPNFMVVGGAKCGTTSLYHYLRSHPQVCAPCKESYLFTPKLIAGTRQNAKVHTEESYHALFDRSTTTQTLAAGEVSSIYLYCHEEVIPEVKRILGDIKILIFLRNPVERAFSHYNFFARDTRDGRTFEEAVAEELRDPRALPRARHYIGMGYYTGQVQAYLDAFSNVKVVLFDDFIADTQAAMDDIYRFLVVDAKKAKTPVRIYNASGMPKIKWLQKLLFKPTPLKMRLRRFLVDHVIDEECFARNIERLRAKNLQQAKIPEPMRQALVLRYRDDIAELQRLIKRDLSAWTS